MSELDDLTTEQKKTVKALAAMSEQEVDSLIKIAKEEPAITAFFSKRKAWALVFGSINKVVLWFAGIAAALTLGLDKIKAVLAYLLQLILS